MTNLNKNNFTVKVGLAEMLKGGAMMRTKGEAGSGNIVEAVRHMRALQDVMKGLELSDIPEAERLATMVGKDKKIR
jgi:pyridoxal biosynthesis lyase PdxS